MADPAAGVVYVLVNRRRVEITDAEYWVERGDFTVRSREFDCFATGDSLDDALSKFGRAVIEYAATLQERTDRKEATAAEEEAYERLSTRLSRIYIEEQREPPRRRFWPRRRGSRHDDHEWGAVPA